MNAEKMRARGWLSSTTLDAADLVIGRRYLVTNGKTVEAAICVRTINDDRFWAHADSPDDTMLGEFRQWPWFKEDRE